MVDTNPKVMKVISSIAFGSLIDRAFVNTDILSVWTLNFLSTYLRIKHFVYFVLVTAQNLPGADLVISPELLFAGGTMDYQHTR